MKKYIILVFFFSSFSLFADTGNAYRFFLQLVSKQSDTITGYFYHYTYDEYDQFEHFNERFKHFIKKDSIFLYSFITTVNIENTNIDFTTSDFKKNICINKLDHIKIIECLDFGVCDRLKELSQSEFNLIKLHLPKSKVIYNEKALENCAYFLLVWDNEFDLSGHYEDINKKLIFLGENVIENQYIFYEYLNVKKEALIEDNVLLIHYCTAL